MSSGKDTRHFHAGKQRKTIGDTIYVSVAESCDTLYKVLGLTPQAICHALNGRTRSCGGFTWIYC